MIRNLFKIVRITPLLRFRFCTNTNEDLLQKLKNQNKPNVVIELENSQQFNLEIQESQNKLIVVYLYAKWHIEQSTFIQELLKKAEENSDYMSILKIDIDKHADIVTALKVRTVPFVGLVYNNQIVDRYTKKQDYPRFETTLDKVLSMMHGKNVCDIVYSDIIEYLNGNDFKKAEELINQALQNKELASMSGKLILSLAYCKASTSDIIAAEALIKQFEKEYQEELKEGTLNDIYDHVNTLIKEAKAIKDNDPELIRLLTEIDAQPDDKVKRYNLCKYCVEKQLYEQAIVQYLDLIKIDRKWEEKKAQKDLLELFNKLGSKNQLVIEARKKLAKILY